MARITPPRLPGWCRDRLEGGKTEGVGRIYMLNESLSTAAGKVTASTVRNGNRNPPDVYHKEIWVPLQNQANRVGMVLTAESP